VFRTTILILTMLLSADHATGQGVIARGPGSRPSVQPSIEAATPRSASEALATVPSIARLQSPDAEWSDQQQHKADQPPATDDRQPSRRVVRRGDATDANSRSRSATAMFDEMASDQLKTLGAALSVVLGLLLALVWIVKRAAPKGVQVAPRDVARVIARVPLAAKQQAQLLHVGNKILLVSISPGGSETLAEIDDQAEVQRIVALCQQSDAGSAKKTFDDVFRSFGQESVSGFLDDAVPTGGRR
jgi:flagellar biogenesis protein FliO